MAASESRLMRLGRLSCPKAKVLVGDGMLVRQEVQNWPRTVYRYSRKRVSLERRLKCDGSEAGSRGCVCFTFRDTRRDSVSSVSRGRRVREEGLGAEQKKQAKRTSTLLPLNTSPTCLPHPSRLFLPPR
ncbi:MAG: hypothetical protein ACKESB_00530 [Candidatus Hodgkinia cicadicola]